MGWYLVGLRIVVGCVLFFLATQGLIGAAGDLMPRRQTAPVRSRQRCSAHAPYAASHSPLPKIPRTFLYTQIRYRKGTL
jgi:hypothetical protein